MKNIKEYLGQNFPHIFVPSCLYARITKFESGSKNNKAYNKVNLKILDIDKNFDPKYAEIPNVRTELSFKEQDIVLLNFVNGELENPVIVRGVIDYERH